jgi:rod shape-determining protein MreB
MDFFKPSLWQLLFQPFRSTVYLRILPEQLSLLHAESGTEFSEVPEIASELKAGKQGVIAVGREARSKAGLSGVTVGNGFKHPRTLLADFTLAEQTLKQFLTRVLPDSLFAVSPVMIIHPLASLQGGLTQIEIRAFAELGHGAGARKVFIWQGRELTRDELRTLSFPEAAGKLLFP